VGPVLTKRRFFHHPYGYGRMKGRKEGKKEGWKEGRKDGRKDGHS